METLAQNAETTEGGSVVDASADDTDGAGAAGGDAGNDANGVVPMVCNGDAVDASALPAWGGDGGGSDGGGVGGFGRDHDGAAGEGREASVGDVNGYGTAGRPLLEPAASAPAALAAASTSAAAGSSSAATTAGAVSSAVGDSLAAAASAPALGGGGDVEMDGGSDRSAAIASTGSISGDVGGAKVGARRPREEHTGGWSPNHPTARKKARSRQAPAVLRARGGAKLKNQKRPSQNLTQGQKKGKGLTATPSEDCNGAVKSNGATALSRVEPPSQVTGAEMETPTKTELEEGEASAMLTGGVVADASGDGDADRKEKGKGTRWKGAGKGPAGGGDGGGGGGGGGVGRKKPAAAKRVQGRGASTGNFVVGKMVAVGGGGFILRKETPGVTPDEVCVATGNVLEMRLKADSHCYISR